MRKIEHLSELLLQDGVGSIASSGNTCTAATVDKDVLSYTSAVRKTCGHWRLSLLNFILLYVGTHIYHWLGVV